MLAGQGDSVSCLLGQIGGGMTRGWRSSLEAELVRVADDCVSVHREGVEHHGWVDEVLLHALQASIQLLKPHHLGSTCNHGQEGGTAVEPRFFHTPPAARENVVPLRGKAGGQSPGCGVRSSGTLEFLSSWGADLLNQMRAIRPRQGMLGLRAGALPIQLSEIKDDDNTVSTGVRTGWVRPKFTVTLSHRTFGPGPCHRLKVTVATWRRWPGKQDPSLSKKNKHADLRPQIQVFKHKLQGIRVAQFSVHCAGLVH